jgi:hypothetical protein
MPMSETGKSNAPLVGAWSTPKSAGLWNPASKECPDALRAMVVPLLSGSWSIAAKDDQQAHSASVSSFVYSFIGFFTFLYR